MTEFRSARVTRAAADGRTIEARAVAYNVLDMYRTRFVPGCFAESLKERLPALCWAHQGSEVVGRITAAREGADGLYVTMRLSDPEAVPRAKQAAAQVRDGDITDVSVGFNRMQERTADDGVTEIVKGELLEVSLVYAGAVPGASVLSIRDRRRAQLTELDRQADEALRYIDAVRATSSRSRHRPHLPFGFGR